MIFAPVLRPISAAEPTSSACPSATTMTSTFAKSSTLTGLSGFMTKGFVRTTLPVGEVNRKMDQDNHSILTGPLGACAAAGAAASPHRTVKLIAPISHRRFAIVFPDRKSVV